MSIGRRRAFIGLAVLTAGALATTAAFAIRGWGKGRLFQRIYERVKTQLALNADQTKKVDALKDRVMGHFRAARKGRTPFIAEAKGIWLADQFDEAKAQALATKIADRHLAHRTFIIGAIKELHGILDKAQRQKLVNLIEKFRGRFKKHWKH